MPIDWLTIFAQVVNFLILVWLLKRFLYKPILNAIDAREKRVAAELAEAAAKKADAQKERDEFDHKNAAFERERDALLTRMREEVQAERQRLLEEARQAADALSAERKEDLHREQQSLNDEIIRRSREEVFAVARKMLTDLAETTLETRMSEVFMRHLRELEGAAKESVVKALETATEPLRVRSAFELPDEQRAAIQQAINQTFTADPATPLKADVHLQFDVVPDVISGIELIVNGRKVAWSIADHLASLGKSVHELLQEQSAARAKPDADAQHEPERSNLSSE